MSQSGLYLSTITQQRDISCVWRHWQSEACKLHGTVLTVKMSFEFRKLHEGQGIDQSAVQPLMEWLLDSFDGKLLVADDDPHINTLRVIEAHGLCELRVLPAVACENIAQIVFDHANEWLYARQISPRAIIRSVECMKHGGYAATYVGNL